MNCETYIYSGIRETTFLRAQTQSQNPSNHLLFLDTPKLRLAGLCWSLSFKIYTYSVHININILIKKKTSCKSKLQPFASLYSVSETLPVTCLNVNKTKRHQRLFTVPAAQSCGPPPTVPSAHVQMEGESLSQNATYVCNAGLQLLGSRTLFCQANGTWSLPAPTCERM